MELKENPLRIKSKKWLVSALLELMKQNPYSKITIREIAELADLDRRTYYRHFSTKDDLLHYYIDLLSEEYFKITKDLTDLTVHKLATAYFEFWFKHFEFLTLIYENNLQFNLLQKYNGYAPQMNQVLESNSQTHGSEHYKHYAIAFRTGGFWNSLMEWVGTGAKETPQELAKIVSDLVVGEFLK